MPTSRTSNCIPYFEMHPRQWKYLFHLMCRLPSCNRNTPDVVLKFITPWCTYRVWLSNCSSVHTAQYSVSLIRSDRPCKHNDIVIRFCSVVFRVYHAFSNVIPFFLRFYSTYTSWRNTAFMYNCWICRFVSVGNTSRYTCMYYYVLLSYMTCEPFLYCTSALFLIHPIR